MLPVGLSYVLGNQCQIAADHLQRRMTQHALKGEHIAAVAQIVDGEGMAKLMRVAGRHADALAQSPDMAAEGTSLQLPPILVDEQPVAGLVFSAFRKVSL